MDQAKGEAQFLLSQMGLTRVFLIPYKRKKTFLEKNGRNVDALPIYLYFSLQSILVRALLRVCMHAFVCVCKGACVRLWPP